MNLLRNKKKNIIKSINSSDVLIDCGANTWEQTQDSLFIDAANKGATIYAFEPNPYAFKKLLENTRQWPNVRCINSAVLDKNGRLKLFLHMNSSENELSWSTGSSLLDFKGNVDKNKYVEVGVVNIVDFINSLNRRVKILKIDVEGVEHIIINKLIDSGIINKIDLILAETHENKIPEIEMDIMALRRRISKQKIKNIDLNWI